MDRTIHAEDVDRTIRKIQNNPARRLESLKITRARRAKGQEGKEGQGPGGPESQEDQEHQKDQKSQRIRRTDREKARQLTLELQLPKFGEVSGKTFPAAEPTEALAKVGPINKRTHPKRAES